MMCTFQERHIRMIWSFHGGVCILEMVQALVHGLRTYGDLSRRLDGPNFNLLVEGHLLLPRLDFCNNVRDQDFCYMAELYRLSQKK